MIRHRYTPEWMQERVEEYLSGKASIIGAVKLARKRSELKKLRDLKRGQTGAVSPSYTWSGEIIDKG